MLDQTISQKVGEEDWDDYVDIKTLVNEANQQFDLTEYIESKYELQTFSSNNGWTRRMKCPFHKSGNERTPSFFINPVKNIYYCQGCGTSGGLVQFIALATNQEMEDVANHIIRIAKQGGAILVAAEQEKKLLQKKKALAVLLKMSDMFRDFIQLHADDEIAIKYIDKIMSGFDLTYELDQNDIIKNAEDLFSNFQNFLTAYDRKKK